MSRLVFKMCSLALGVGLLALLYALVTPRLLEHELGPRTAAQIENKFRNCLERDYELLILGNSRIYRGLNPAVMDHSAYNFALEEDAFNQCFYKLDYLRRNGKRFRYLVLGVDYFEFSALNRTRNYVYARYFDAAYMQDYASPGSTIFSYFQNMNLEFDDFVARTFTNTFPMFLPALVHHLRGSRVSSVAILEANGMLIQGSPARPAVLAGSRLVRDGRRLRVQEAYFEKILALAGSQGIPVFLVMPPANHFELRTYQPGTLAASEAYLKRQVQPGKVTYLNYLRDSRFGLVDYADVAHLAPAAADRFSRIVDGDIQKALNHDLSTP